jgi:hypothetical protein
MALSPEDREKVRVLLDCMGGEEEQLKHDKEGTMAGAFAGEIMTCVMCGVQQRHDPGEESNWRALELNGELFYACASEFPSKEADYPGMKVLYMNAYTKILSKIITLHETVN